MPRKARSDAEKSADDAPRHVRAQIAFDGLADQCDMSTGTVMLSSTVRVAPPSTSSRSLEWP